METQLLKIETEPDWESAGSDELKEQIIEAATDYKNDVMVSADTGAAESTDSQADGNNN